jgi:hypothetical protein
MPNVLVVNDESQIRDLLAPVQNRTVPSLPCGYRTSAEFPFSHILRTAHNNMAKAPDVKMDIKHLEVLQAGALQNAAREHLT